MKRLHFRYVEKKGLLNGNCSSSYPRYLSRTGSECAQINKRLHKRILKIKSQLKKKNLEDGYPVTRVADSEPDPQQSGKLDPDPDPHPHQREKVDVLEGQFGALEGPNLEKSE
jgi:hypothetical protein